MAMGVHPFDIRTLAASLEDNDNRATGCERPCEDERLGDARSEISEESSVVSDACSHDSEVSSASSFAQVCSDSATTQRFSRWEASADAPPSDPDAAPYESVLEPCAAAPSASSDETLKKKSKVKKALDPVEVAKRRIWKRQRKEANARKKARKLEKAKQKKRRGAQQDTEAFLMKTVERLKQRSAELVAEAIRAELKAKTCVASRHGVDAEEFLAKTKARVTDKSHLAEAHAAAQAAADVAKVAEARAKTDLEAFRKQCKDRVVQNMWSFLPQVKLGLVPLDNLDSTTCFFRRRIAIVGAGPVGLWAAMLIVQKYRVMECSSSLARRPDAPEVVVFEGRAAAKHCSRTDIRIALSTGTLHLLNSRAKSQKFSSGMPLADIEKALYDRWRRIAPKDSQVQFSKACADPAALHTQDGFDCVLWAGGRRSLDDALRHQMGCEIRVSQLERVLVFQLSGVENGSELSADLSTVVNVAAKRSGLRILVRPGVAGVCDGWLWMFGIPQEAILAAITPAATIVTTSCEKALETIVDISASQCALGLHTAAEALQQRLRPAECSARWVEAAYWSSDKVVCDLGDLDKSAVGCPLVLLGDASRGKPFYTGTTLNGHFKEVARMIDEVDWTHDGAPFAPTRFRSYQQRYQDDLASSHQYERSCSAAPPSTESSAPQMDQAPKQQPGRQFQFSVPPAWSRASDPVVNKVKLQDAVCLKAPLPNRVAGGPVRDLVHDSNREMQ